MLQDVLDRSLALAAAMDSRGFGRAREVSAGARRLTTALSLAGLVGAALGTYGLLDTTGPAVLGVPTLLVGLLLVVAGLRAGGRRVQRTVHRPDRWGLVEWLVAGCGLVVAASSLVAARLDPVATSMPLQPLAWPQAAGARRRRAARRRRPGRRRGARRGRSR
ncbi:hypothetical protein GCM10025868_42760 [Angustibacter aerolatus]|uniref:Uncharacterized protein n=1 Tax=Angustibacter aerolatus TaxID=1162965 RepID=A0ABQ6JN89_9ACTN|nr:hypothetical protein GCM10025868_42760 [Angustibacter aerolatus]